MNILQHLLLWLTTASPSPPHEPNQPEGKLIKLAILHRHGDRVPEKSYAYDPYPCTDLKHWPEGEGQLTIHGKKRMLELGKFVRKRYSHFLSDNPIEVFARSSPLDRCLNSAQLVLTGAYPPRGRLVFDPFLRWQPIPVHTESDETEQMLITPSKMQCPATQAAKALQFKSPDVKAYEASQRDYLDLIEKHSGNNMTSLKAAHDVYDALNGDRENGKRLPDWVTDDLFNKLEEMNDKISCINSSSPLIQRLDSGVFLNDLKQNFENKIVKDFVEKTVFFYSTHDSKLMPVLKALGIFDGNNPTYGSTLFFELHQVGKDDDRVIRVYYLTDTERFQVKEPLQTRGCPAANDCSVNAFFVGLADFLTDEATHAADCNDVPVASVSTGCF